MGFYGNTWTKFVKEEINVYRTIRYITKIYVVCVLCNAHGMYGIMDETSTSTRLLWVCMACT
jgi:hypothetical protein